MATNWSSPCSGLFYHSFSLDWFESDLFHMFILCKLIYSFEFFLVHQVGRQSHMLVIEARPRSIVQAIQCHSALKPTIKGQTRTVSQLAQVTYSLPGQDQSANWIILEELSGTFELSS